MLKAFLTFILMLFFPTAPLAEPLDGIGDGKPLVIESSMGGSVIQFQIKALQLFASGTPVIIDGPCMSACTLLVDVDRKNVCLTTKAILGYHKAANRNEQGEVTESFPLNYETPGLNAYLKSRGGLPEPDAANLLLMDFNQAKQFYKPCPGAS